MERQQLHEHIHAKCLHTVTLCKYEGIGCDIELKREDVVAHEQDDKLHLHMALETVNSLQNTIKEERQTLRCNVNSSMTYAFPDFQKNKDAKTYVLSELFYTHPNGYRMALVVVTSGCHSGEGTHVSVYVSILKGKYDGILKWPFIGRIHFTLLNQLEDKNHHTDTLDLTAADNACRGDDWGIHQYIHHSALAHNLVKKTQYLKDDTLYIRVFVEAAEYKPWLEYKRK